MRIKPLIASLAWGMLLTIAVYLLSNLSFPISSENHALKWAYQLTSRFRNNNRPIPDDVLIINTSFDRQLVTIYDDFGFEKGNVDITDRDKLVDLLQMLNESGSYAYIIIDLRFEQGMETTADSLLYELICTTPRLVIPEHADLSHADERFAEKSAMADFTASIDEGDFTKYLIAPGNKESMALKVYQDCTGTHYHSFCGFYFSEGCLMRRAMLINLDINPQTDTDAEGYKKVYNLGADILEYPDDSKALFDNKFIYIGDCFERDMHPTYKGSMSGVAIHANAVTDLFAKKHLINWLTFIAIWLVLSIIIFAIIHPNKLKQKLNFSRLLPSKLKSNKHLATIKPILTICWSLLGYGTLLTAIFFLIYLITGQIYEIIFVSIILTILSLFHKNPS